MKKIDKLIHLSKYNKLCLFKEIYNKEMENTILQYKLDWEKEDNIKYLGIPSSDFIIINATLIFNSLNQSDDNNLVDKLKSFIYNKDIEDFKNTILKFIIDNNCDKIDREKLYIALFNLTFL